MSFKVQRPRIQPLASNCEPQRIHLQGYTPPSEDAEPVLKRRVFGEPSPPMIYRVGRVYGKTAEVRGLHQFGSANPKLATLLIFMAVLFTACTPYGKWLPIPASATPGVSRIEDNDTVIIDMNCCRLSTRGEWHSGGSSFFVRLENQGDSPVKLDLDTLFTYERSASVKQDHLLYYVSRRRDRQNGGEYLTASGPASEHLGRIFGEEPPGTSFEDLLTVEPGGSTFFALTFKVFPQRDKQPHGVLRVVLHTEGVSEVAESRFRAKR